MDLRRFYVMSELTSTQYSFESLRSWIDGTEADTDARGLHEGQEGNLSDRIRRFEESISLHQINESLNRILRLEASVGHGRIGVNITQRLSTEDESTGNWPYKP